jgi:hypothetical protein
VDQEVGGSSPPSCTRSKLLKLRNFAIFGLVADSLKILVGDTPGTQTVLMPWREDGTVADRLVGNVVVVFEEKASRIVTTLAQSPAIIPSLEPLSRETCGGSRPV